MDLSFLPNEINISLNKVNIDFLYEIRLRENYPVIVNYSFKRYFLSNNGLTINENEGIICPKGYIDKIIGIITEYSIYAYNDRIKQGYITINDGIRVGIAGNCVFNGDKISTIKEITSLLIRLPHQVKGCGLDVYNNILYDGQVLSSLICSPPFCGKTTILKDLARIINDNHNLSILIIDERGEFERVSGVNIDKIKYSDKLYAFNCGVRSLAPEIIITDELSGESDFNCVMNAVNSGVKIIASCHTDNEIALRKKIGGYIGLFDRYIFIDKTPTFGMITKIFDKDFNLI